MQGILNTRTPFYLNHPLGFDRFVFGVFFPLKPSYVLPLEFILLIAVVHVAFVQLGPDSASLMQFEIFFLCCVNSGTCELTCYSVLGKIALCHLLDLHLLVKQNVIFSPSMLF